MKVAYGLLFTTGPTVYTPDDVSHFVGRSVSIGDYLRERAVHEALEGDLTEYEYSTDDEDEEPAPRSYVQRRGVRGHEQRPEACGTGTPDPFSRKEKRRAQHYRRRLTGRTQKQELASTGLKAVAGKRCLGAVQDTIKFEDFDLNSCVNVSASGWIGSSLQDLPTRLFTSKELQQEYGMVHFAWDGSYAPGLSSFLIFTQRTPRKTHLLLDREHRVVGALVGRPRNAEDWEAVHDQALKALESATLKMNLAKKATKNRRGQYHSIAHGISFGGGQKVRTTQCQP